MALLIKPDYIIVYDHKKRYIYYCPKCNMRLTDRVSRGVPVNALLPFAPLKRYWSDECLDKYFTYQGKFFAQSVKAKKSKTTQLLQVVPNGTY